MANYLIHPVLQDMINLGCRNQFSVGIAYQVYMNLCEVQAMRDVKYLYNKELDMLYLTAVKQTDANSSKNSEIFLPLSTVSEITPAWIKKVQDTLCSDREDKGLTLAMKEHDSTVVFYRMTQGLVPPDSPETARRKKQREEQKHCIETEVHRMKNDLLERARNDKVGQTSAQMETETNGDVNKPVEENSNEQVSSTQSDTEKSNK
ncbi:hypothetical protein L9F63_008047 [Diploptera punctata]|uniref:tRNA-splicing endonuclease subunit Sen15 domain-containing protein n=1 Tax=Diploptera punctata TaxID=6984 RepID=A0AAD8E2E9_DIPPU|nr:hypothetical protein L9F63_008047 [Diploptera punctata]